MLLRVCHRCWCHFHDLTAAALPSSLAPRSRVRPAVDLKSGAVPQNRSSLRNQVLSYGGYTARQEIEFHTPRADTPLLRTCKAAARAIFT